MHVVLRADAPPYQAPGHDGMRMHRLQGKEAGPSDTVWMGISEIEPGGGTSMTAATVEKFYVVLDGELEVRTHGPQGAGVAHLKRLDSCRIAPEEARQLVNVSGAPCTVLLIMPNTTRAELLQMNDVFPHLAMRPRVSPQAFVATSATVVGDVVIEEEASVWYGSVLRGDVGAIRVGAGSNIQDLCLLHVSTGGPPCEVGAWCTVGHGVILHSCRLEDHAFVGFGARVLDGARVCSHGVLGAGAVLPPGKIIGERELWLGNPAKLIRKLSDEEVLKYSVVARRYAELKQQYLSAAHT